MTSLHDVRVPEQRVQRAALLQITTLMSALNLAVRLRESMQRAA